MKKIYFVLIFYFYTTRGSENELLGCFKNIPKNSSTSFPHVQLTEECATVCLRNYYRYYNFYHGECTCSNFLGEQITNVTCEVYCSSNSNCDNSVILTNVYATGNNVPGPPRNLLITNVTSNSCRILWKEPESFVNINGYVVRAVVLKTFSNYPPNILEWSFGNDSFQTEISNLLPATRYNISVHTLSNDGNGASTYQVIVTRLAEPDNLPAQPVIVSNNGEKMTVKLSPTMNNNGPVSSYRIVVVRPDDNQAFQKDNVLSFNEAKKNGLSYYVAAEINPQDINKEFIVGDGKRYGLFYNAPLNPDVNYNVLVGLVSNFNEETKIAYSEASGYHNGISILNVYSTVAEDSPAVIIGLSVAIGLLTFMFITGIIGFLILKSRIVSRRQRLSENQELTLQGPMIEVENNGYIHEEDHIPAITHYRNLKQKVRTIPASKLKIEPTNLLGVGKFGKVNSGTLHESETLTTVTCYSIYDKKMNQETKRGMLQELDVLIKTGKNDNIINLIGTSETKEMVVVVMEYASMNLKDLLLGSRDHLPGKFSNMSEKQALEIAVGICRGMKHLQSANIVHKQLCARSILISNGFTPKVGSYGLAQYFSHNKIPDYTRWTALEVFKGHPHNPKSDIWSFSCLLWEIAALGGTPYGNIPNNNEIPDNLSKGVRLPQLRYVSDDFYQIMLDCWQLIPDERPKFEDLIESLENLKENNLIPALSFTVYSNFQYEQFYPDMELSVRPVF